MDLNPLTILLVVAMLLAAGASGEDVESVRLVVDGDHLLDDPAGMLLVTGGTVTLPGSATTDGSAYVGDGRLVVRGTVDGDLVVLGGAVSVESGATVTGDVRAFGGTVTIDPGATVVGRVERGFPTDTDTGPNVGALVLQTLVLAALGAVFADRRPRLLNTVGDALVSHPVVSLTVGGLSAVTGLALAVLLVFTIVLVPVSVFGLLLAGAVVAYATVVYGSLVGRVLPFDREWLAVAAGVVVFELALVLLSQVPVVGSLAVLALVVSGVGAILVTGFGLRPFEPPALE